MSTQIQDHAFVTSAAHNYRSVELEKNIHEIWRWSFTIMVNAPTSPGWKWYYSTFTFRTLSLLLRRYTKLNGLHPLSLSGQWLNSFLNVKALVGLVDAFSVIVKLQSSRRFVSSSTAMPGLPPLQATAHSQFCNLPVAISIISGLFYIWG